MTDLVVPFITGLTTGGLSCLAVQGGLLASSIASTAEKEIQQELAAKQAARVTQRTQLKQPTHPHRKRGKHSHDQAAPFVAAALTMSVPPIYFPYLVRYSLTHSFSGSPRRH